MKMKAHWVQKRTDYGQLVANTDEQPDLYLTEIAEWHSKDGQTWERLPDSYEVYTGGTTDPIGRHGGDAAPCSMGEALSNYDYPGLDVDRYVEPVIEVVRWSVDTAGIRREFAAATLPDIG